MRGEGERKEGGQVSGEEADAGAAGRAGEQERGNPDRPSILAVTPRLASSSRSISLLSLPLLTRPPHLFTHALSSSLSLTLAPPDPLLLLPSLPPSLLAGEAQRQAGHKGQAARPRGLGGGGSGLALGQQRGDARAGWFFTPALPPPIRPIPFVCDPSWTIPFRLPLRPLIPFLTSAPLFAPVPPPSQIARAMSNAPSATTPLMQRSASAFYQRGATGPPGAADGTPGAQQASTIP